MQIGKFVYGMVDGTIEKWQDKNVDTLLREPYLRFLYDLGRHGSTLFGTFIYIWEADQAISKTVLKPAQDPSGRSDLLNRTVIIKFNGDAMRYILDHTALIADTALPNPKQEN